MADDILLDVRDLRVSFGPVRAVDGVSLAISRGPFGIALVGESGSGKTTVGRAILRLVPASGGTIAFEGQDVLGLRAAAARLPAGGTDRVPGRGQQPGPADADRGDHRRGADRTRAGGPRRRRRPGGCAAVRGCAGPGAGVPVPAPAVRRAAPAGRDRPRACRLA